MNDKFLTFVNLMKSKQTNEFLLGDGNKKTKKKNKNGQDEKKSDEEEGLKKI